jgi:hypothetical protein
MTRPAMADILQPCTVGAARLEVFEVGKPTARMMMRPDEYVAPGRYVRLLVGGVLYMSDTSHEWRTGLPFVLNAHGDVLVTGLGIGFTLVPVLANAKVGKVLVIEKSADVVQAVTPQLRSLPGAEKLEVRVGDAYTHKPSERFNTIWHDIWADQSTDALNDMTTLKRRYAPHLVRKTVDARSWQGCWREHELRYRRTQEKRSGW